MHYFLLSYQNKKFVCSNKNTLIAKADEIVSQHMFNMVTQTGPSFSYEKRVYENNDETIFSIVTKSCNSLFSHEQEEKICSIFNAELVDFEETVCVNPESPRIDNQEMMKILLNTLATIMKKKLIKNQKIFYIFINIKCCNFQKTK